MAQFPVEVKITAIDNASKAMKNIGKNATGMRGALGKIASTATGVLGGLVAFKGVESVFNGLSESINRAAQMGDLSGAFKQLKKDSDVTVEAIKKASKNTVTSFDAVKSANQAMMLGIDADALPKMMEIARVTAKAMGIDVNFAFESIATGIGRQSKLILDNLGIVIDTNAAYEKYATSLGKLASELTDTEKKQAYTNEVLEVGQEKVDALGDSAEDSATTKLQQFQTAIQEVKDGLGDVLLPVVTTVIGELQDIWTETADSWTNLYDAVGELGREILGLSDDSVTAKNIIVDSVNTMLQLFTEGARGYALMIRDIKGALGFAPENPVVQILGKGLYGRYEPPPPPSPLAPPYPYGAQRTPPPTGREEPSAFERETLPPWDYLHGMRPSPEETHPASSSSEYPVAPSYTVTQVNNIYTSGRDERYAEQLRIANEEINERMLRQLTSDAWRRR